MKSAKSKITSIVKSYVQLFPEEFDTFTHGVQALREISRDKFASAKHQGSPDMRALFEMPVTLHDMLIKGLAPDELDWFKQGGSDRKQGARWFARSFPAFKVPNVL